MKPDSPPPAAACAASLGQRPAPRKSTVSPDFHRAVYGSLKPVMRGGRDATALHSSSHDAVLHLYRRALAARRRLRRFSGRSQAKEFVGE